jgi:hypothetical protein
MVITVAIKLASQDHTNDRHSKAVESIPGHVGSGCRFSFVRSPTITILVWPRF